MDLNKMVRCAKQSMKQSSSVPQSSGMSGISFLVTGKDHLDVVTDKVVR